MRKLVLTILAALLLVSAAAAYSIENSQDPFDGNLIFTDGINNDPAVQAQMLFDLGLFKGRGEGDFALDSTMTREEAAVMLTRFLGEESKALERNIPHPFTDVADWADPYVGWLYYYGYTKGMGGSKYGGNLNVTYWQFGKFLARATEDARWSEEMNMLTKEEITLLGEKPIPRAQAVSLSTRALQRYYWRDTTYGADATAKWLQRHGVFTAQQFAKAAWHIYGTRFGDGRSPVFKLETVEENGTQYAVLLALGEEVARSTVPGLRQLGYDYPNYPPAVWAYTLENGRFDLYELEMPTMKTVAHGTVSVEDSTGFNHLASVGGRHYILGNSRSETGGIRGGLLLSWDGETLHQEFSAETLWQNTGGYVFGLSLHKTTGNRLFKGADSLYLLTAEGAKRTPVPGGELFTWDGKTAVLQTEGETEVTVTCVDLESGAVISQYTVPQDKYGRKLHTKHLPWLYGEAGLYRYENGILTQITDKPVQGMGTVTRNGQQVTLLLSHEVDARYSGHVSFGGDRIYSLQDGELTLEFLAQPEWNVKISVLENSATEDIVFYSASDVGMQHFDIYRYSLQNGKLRVLSFEAGRPEILVTEATKEKIEAAYKEQALAEQDRLYALGLAEKPGHTPLVENDAAAVFQQVLEIQTVLASYAKNGESDVYRVAAGKTVTGQYDYTVYGETVHYLYGEAGLYKLQKGRLLQMTDMPVEQMEFFRNGPSHAMALVSRDEKGNAQIYSAWDWGDGVLDKLILHYTCLPTHGISNITLPKNTESLQFCTETSHGTYTYLVLGTAEQPNIWTIGYEAKDPNAMTKTWSEYLWDEIDRLHALGISAPGPSGI